LIVPIDHYETLGVDPRSEYEAIRQAWVAAARTHHPDAMIGASAEEIRWAEIRMHEINEAWRVLGSEELRKAYDKDRNQKNRIEDAEQESWDEQWSEDEFDLDDFEHQGFEVRSPIVALILRSIPWLLIAAIGVTIFVFSAFATGGAPRQMPAQECLAQSENGEITRPFDCGEAGALRIVAEPPGPIESSYCRQYALHPNSYRIPDPQEANKYYCVESIGD
tara:strand:+ start:8637 stop:9299 length:663 start_codon:yes stop_codon:yes gene_type:complete